MSSEKIISKRTADGRTVEVWLNANGTANVSSGGGISWTGGWIALAPSVALLVAGEASLFNAAEMPHLIRAAAKLAKRGTVLPGELRAAASLASHKAGTRPVDVAPPVAPMVKPIGHFHPIATLGGIPVRVMLNGAGRIVPAMD